MKYICNVNSPISEGNLVYSFILSYKVLSIMITECFLFEVGFYFEYIINKCNLFCQFVIKRNSIFLKQKNFFSFFEPYFILTILSMLNHYFTFYRYINLCIQREIFDIIYALSFFSTNIDI